MTVEFRADPDLLGTSLTSKETDRSITTNHRPRDQKGTWAGALRDLQEYRTVNQTGLLY